MKHTHSFNFDCIEVGDCYYEGVCEFDYTLSEPDDEPPYNYHSIEIIESSVIVHSLKYIDEFNKTIEIPDNEISEKLATAIIDKIFTGCPYGFDLMGKEEEKILATY